jgi:hypothetical protein
MTANHRVATTLREMRTLVIMELREREHRMPSLGQIVAEGILYDIIKWFLASVVIGSGLTFIAGKILKRLEDRKEALVFFSVSFVMIFVLIFVMAPRSQGPQFGGNIQTITAGGYNGDHDSIAVISLDVLNSGSMQSIAKNWRVKAKIGDNVYDGMFVAPPPKSVTFNMSANDIRDSDPLSPTGITFHGDDNILDRAINPIASGGQLEGLLFVLFRGISPTTFKTGANYTVSFEDVYGREYDFSLATSAKLGQFAAVSGIHSDLICRAPAADTSAAPNATPVPSLPKL